MFINLLTIHVSAEIKAEFEAPRILKELQSNIQEFINCPQINRKDLVDKFAIFFLEDPTSVVPFAQKYFEYLSSFSFSGTVVFEANFYTKTDNYDGYVNFKVIPDKKTENELPGFCFITSTPLY